MKKIPIILTLSLVAMSYSMSSTAHAASLGDFFRGILGPSTPPEAQIEDRSLPEETIEAYSNEELVQDDAVRGSADAPVTIVEFMDYECPYCQRHFRETFPEIKKQYIDTGKVKYVVRDYPLSFHSLAASAAIATECARSLGGDKAFFRVHDHLLGKMRSARLTKRNIVTALQRSGVNRSEVLNCWKQGKFQDEIDLDAADADRFGVNGTPHFFINGEKVSGAQPFGVFQSLIEEKL